MIHSIRIQNFKSLRDVTLRLQDVNLLIGPNNSGKSNLLKALAFLGRYLRGHNPDNEELKRLSFQHKMEENESPIEFTVCYKSNDGGGFYYYGLRLYYRFIVQEDNEEFFGISKQYIPLSQLHDNDNVIIYDIVSMDDDLKEELRNSKLYNIKLSAFTGITTEQVVELKGDASNLMSYLDYLNNNHPFQLDKIAEELNKCVSDFKLVRTPQIDLEKKDNVRQVKLFDKNGIGFWADEVSEGTLYFLALLCIIFQPKPPSILMLEEPEKGIHPRRLHEVMEYIFQLAESKNIQVIMTSHSTQVVDRFKDLEEHIFIFNKPENETIIKNLWTEVIAEKNKKAEDKNLPPIQSSGESLGQDWYAGLLDGVPQ